MPAALTLISTSPGPQTRQGEGREAQSVEKTAFAGLESQRHRGIEPLLAVGRPRPRRLDVARLAAEGDFAFGIVPQQFMPEQRIVRGGRRRGRSMPRQEKFGCSLRITRKKPIEGCLRHGGRAPSPGPPTERRA